MFRLDGKRALVTGGASGIGAATCRAFAEAGSEVLVADIDEAGALRLAGELPHARALRLDVSREDSARAVFASLERLDILVNNAGIGLVGGIEETAPGDFDRLIEVNVRGVFLVTQAAMPLLVASHGCIINIGSVAGLRGVKKRFAYCATKGAILAMTLQLAVDYPTQIRVNCIAPATVHTPFVEAYLEKNYKHEKDAVRDQLHARQPIGRMGRPEEIASLAVYLASDEAAFVTGSIMAIDGGWTAR